MKKTVKAILAEVFSGNAGCLRHISTGKSVVIVIGATNGTETLVTADDVFSWIGPDFKNFGCDKVEQPTPDTSVEVYEQVENADYRKIFSSFGQNLDRLCLTTPQIKTFVRDHADNYLREEGWAVFLFLFKVRNVETGKDEFFVAHVIRREVGDSKVTLSPLSYNNVWSAKRRHRVVVPKL
ncbi:MAG: hypothetical protein Q8P86_04075 [bacterium]|nr:hypothetical protein [bacterium]